MPGAAGIRAANYLYNVAPKDGTVIGMVDQAVYLDQILGTAGLNVDASKFNWIGRILSNSAVLYARQGAEVKKIEDVFTHELIVSTSGAASRLNWTVLNNLLGTKFKIIPGYQGSNDSRMALVRGEVDALSQPWPVLKVEGEQLLRDKQINLLLQTGADKNRGAPASAAHDRSWRKTMRTAFCSRSSLRHRRSDDRWWRRPAYRRAGAGACGRRSWPQSTIRP